MSKNKYSLPFDGAWYIEYGGFSIKNSHSFDMIDQRYAYDFEIRDRYNLPYFDDCLQCSSYYSYRKFVKAPFEGLVVDIGDNRPETEIRSGRPIVCSGDDPKGNYIVLKHPHGEYSVICHLLKNSFYVEVGDLIQKGDLLALVGNSGNTQGPHLHFHVQNSPYFNKAVGIKISFTNIYKEKKASLLHACFTHHIHKDEVVRNR